MLILINRIAKNPPCVFKNEKLVENRNLEIYWCSVIDPLKIHSSQDLGR